MKKISIKEAISSGEWLQYEKTDDDITMKLKLLSIREVQLEEIGDIDEVDKNIPLHNGRLLLLSIELINFSHVKHDIPNLALIDQEDYKFDNLFDPYLMYTSDFAKRYSFYNTLFPKLKYKVDFLFVVPVEDMLYFLGAVYGTIKRI